MFLYNPKSRKAAFSFRCACFKCRIAFHDATLKKERPCPECGKEMVNVGHHFRAPRRANVRRWKALEKYVVEHGMTFDGKDGNGFVPRSIGDLNHAIDGIISDHQYYNDPRHLKTSWKARPRTVGFHSRRLKNDTRW
jgi:hypothetical protein